jgi:hypothetical protein
VDRVNGAAGAGSAVLRCCSANIKEGVTLAAAARSFLPRPLTIQAQRRSIMEIQQGAAAALTGRPALR